MLEDGNRRISDKRDIEQHIYEFYKKLFGKVDRGEATIASDDWTHIQVSKAANEQLTRPLQWKRLSLLSEIYRLFSLRSAGVYLDTC
uniref:Uncharacterized protein n=1 Tax=Arundo donax TaxID=35708 RepID=A0A0A8ZLB1_ARUDO